MVVIAAHMELGLRRRTSSTDGYGTRVVAAHGPVEGPLPGRIVSEPAMDGDLETGPGVWVLAVDHAFWPLAAGDWLVEVGGAGRSWTVREAAHRPSVFDDAVSYVRVESALNPA